MVSAEVGIVSLASAGLPSLLLSFPSSSPPCSDPGSPHSPLILLSSPEPKPPPRLHLGWEPHPSPGSWACGSGRQFSHPAAPLLPIAAGCVRSLAPIHCLSLSPPALCPPLWLCLPFLVVLSCSAPLLSAWPFLQGSLHLALLSLPSSLRVSGAAPGALAPAPAPSLLSLLSFWKVQSPGRLAGWKGRWVCAVSFCD